MPPGMHYRRGHWVKNSRKKKQASGGWIGAALLAVALYALSHGYGDPHHASTHKPATSRHHTR
jgi:hypothetical protein